MSLDDHGTLGSREVVEQELRDFRVCCRMELSLGMLDNVDTRPRPTGRERRHRDRENMREPPAGLQKSHVGVAGRRSDHQLGVTALRHDIDTHPEGPAIPLANRFPEIVVRRQRQGRIPPIRSKDHRRVFYRGERRFEEATRTRQMANAEGPGFEAVDSRFDPSRKIVRLSGDQSSPINLPRILLRSRDKNLVGRSFVEPLPLHYDLMAVTPEAPVRNLALGRPGRRLHIPDGGRKRYLVAVVRQGGGHAQPTMHRTPGHQVLERLPVANSAGLQRKRFRCVLP